MFPAQVSAVLTRLEQAGFPAYAVGGCVRDTLLGRTPEDWDVTTAARPEQTAAAFPWRSPPSAPTGRIPTTAAPTPCIFPIRWRRISAAAT